MTSKPSYQLSVLGNDVKTVISTVGFMKWRQNRHINCRFLHDFVFRVILWYNDRLLQIALKPSYQLSVLWNSTKTVISTVGFCTISQYNTCFFILFFKHHLTILSARIWTQIFMPKKVEKNKKIMQKNYWHKLFFEIL